MAGRLFARPIFLWLSALSIWFIVSSCQYRPRHKDSTYRERQEYTNRETKQRQIGNKMHSIPLSFEDGVYYLIAKVNDVPMKFIFDTGASTISMSITEAQFLYKQSLLREDDFMGTINFQDANGDISEGLIVNLRSVTIGDITMHDIKASIVGNQEAPLLLGQSALQRLGKISIDYRNNQLIIE